MPAFSHAQDYAYPAQVTKPVDNQFSYSKVSAFRSYGVVKKLSITVPTIVSVEVPETLRPEVAVVSTYAQKIEPSYVKMSTETKPIEFSLNSRTSAGSTLGMAIDKNVNTYAEFPLTQPNTSMDADLTIFGDAPITSSSITLTLDSNVAPPIYIEMTTQKNDYSDPPVTVIARRAYTGNVIRFPSTTAQVWNLVLTHDQPLRIAELEIAQANAEHTSTREVRFLAQPGELYEIFYDSDSPVSLVTAEAGDLSYVTDVVHATMSMAVNPQYKLADTDSDGVPDAMDKCPSIADPKQEDLDGNGIGDACEDFDHDGIINTKDNCPDKPNVSQADADGDGIGDVCDTLDNRFTEQHKWIPWVGIGSAAVVLIVLFGLTARSMTIKDGKPK